MTGTRSRPQPAQNATTANTSRPLKSSGTRLLLAGMFCRSMAVSKVCRRQ
ncbi:KRT15 isoform 4 [Pan troglodytes]|uniref:Keratin 15 n=2 Tax=Homininae TaxID=207598 RepID=K7EQK9_HUMAN|nr:keratin 15 [Homo sapiens]KAI4049444.1 keratin 15 [Homo sapiens]PNI34043.1 KRT15 isoform 4 [Pan troglodytes]